jgi:hypothetical protein
MISDAPEGTKSFVLIVDDPDIPEVVKKSHGLEAFDHWVLYNIPVPVGGEVEVPAGATPGSTGLNSAGGMKYISPCPPSQYEPKEHRYVFTLYALNEMLHFPNAPTARQVRDALTPFLLAKTKLIGRYSRP